MASDPKRPKLAEDFSPSVKISEVLDVIKEKYFRDFTVHFSLKSQPDIYILIGLAFLVFLSFRSLYNATGSMTS